MASKRAHRRTLSRSIVPTGSDSASANSSTTAEQDEFDKMKMHRAESLKQSKEYLENQGRNYVSRDERHYRLLNIFEKQVNNEKLELSFFDE